MNSTIKRIGLVAAGAALFVVVAWYFAFFSPQARNLSAAHKDHAAAEQKVSQLQNQLVQLDALKAQIPADQAALSVLNAAVPPSPQLDSTLIQLHTVATTSGVSLSSVSPSAPPTTASSAQQSSSTQQSGSPDITLTMSASGSYQQLMTFLTGLASMPRVVVVTSVNITGTSQLTAQIIANIFYTGGSK
jgi:type IV pilus assembly protein PilO